LTLYCKKHKITDFQERKGVNFFLIILLLFFASSVNAGELYEWKDEKGSTHFSDSLSSVPSKYQNQFKQQNFKGADKTTIEAPAAKKVPPHPAYKPSGKTPKKYEVPYIPYEDQKNNLGRRIIVEVKFNNSVTAPMILDTGAPGLSISLKLANRLGLLDNNSGGKLITQSGGIGGKTPSILTIIDSVQIGDVKDKFVPTSIMKSISNKFEGLLGMFFLDNYHMKVDTTKKVLIFEKIPGRENLPGGHDRNWWESIFLKFRSRQAYWQKTKNYYSNQNFNSKQLKKQREMHSIAASAQYNEATKLLNKLNLYAGKHSVPSQWRKY